MCANASWNRHYAGMGEGSVGSSACPEMWADDRALTFNFAKAVVRLMDTSYPSIHVDFGRFQDLPVCVGERRAPICRFRSRFSM